MRRQSLDPMSSCAPPPTPPQENLVVPLHYTVNPNCTGSYTVPDGPSFDLFIAPNGDAISVISTAPPGNNVSTIDQRVSSK